MTWLFYFLNKHSDIVFLANIITYSVYKISVFVPPLVLVVTLIIGLFTLYEKIKNFIESTKKVIEQKKLKKLKKDNDI